VRTHLNLDYADFVARLVKLTQVPEHTVRKVLSGFPETLMTLRENEQVRTPLGTFRKDRRPEMQSLAPGQKERVKVPPAMIVRLRPGRHLKANIVKKG
jgi:nucleoid DNA-binding protein